MEAAILEVKVVAREDMVVGSRQEWEEEVKVAVEAAVEEAMVEGVGVVKADLVVASREEWEEEVEAGKLDGVAAGGQVDSSRVQQAVASLNKAAMVVKIGNLFHHSHSYTHT